MRPAGGLVNDRDKAQREGNRHYGLASMAAWCRRSHRRLGSPGHGDLRLARCCHHGRGGAADPPADGCVGRAPRRTIQAEVRNRGQVSLSLLQIQSST